MKKKLLLHICCATCAACVLRKLKSDYQVTAFYYNPNIYPAREYQKRFLEAKKFCIDNSIPFIEYLPDQNRWLALTKGHEQDPERGERCRICYHMRLERTAQCALDHDFDMFGTDLSISPHKDAVQLNIIGQEIEKKYGVRYLIADFKKQNGFKQAMVFSQERGFYRQNYCGCIYSLSNMV